MQRRYSQSERRLTNYLRDEGRQSAVVLVPSLSDSSAQMPGYGDPHGLKTDLVEHITKDKISLAATFNQSRSGGNSSKFAPMVMQPSKP